jgi:hypothetical protein
VLFSVSFKAALNVFVAEEQALRSRERGNYQGRGH